MLKSTHGRMIVINCAVFLAVFSLLLLFFTQGTQYFYTQQMQKQMIQNSFDAELTVKQQLQLYHLDADPEKGFSDNAEYFCHLINNQTAVETQLYNAHNVFLNGSKKNTTDLSDLLAGLNEQQTAMIQVSKENNVSVMKYVSPIKYNNTVIGIVAFVEPIDKVETIIALSRFFYLLGLFIFIPLIILYSDRSLRTITDPIRGINSAVKRIIAGEYTLQIDYDQQNEIGVLSAGINQMLQIANTSINQVESERERLARVFASLDDGVLTVDHSGDIIMCNNYIETYLNVASPKSIYDFQYQSFMRNTFDDLCNGKAHVSFEIECNDRNLLIIGSPLNGEELAENFLIIIRNVTAEHQMQKEQHKFISSVSHELRTPLTTIIGYTDMLTRRGITDAAILDRSLSTINREGHRLLRLVDDLINVNKFDHYEFAYHKTNVDLNELLNDIVEQMNIKAQAQEISINFKTDNDLPEIFGDYDRLSQLFINIIHNAIKYSNSGDLIDVVAACEDGHIVISVRDYGVGIPETEQKKIFAAFYRVEEDRNRSENEGGAGLGLFLVKQIVDNHEGTIDVQSIIGEGTIFTIAFPIRHSEEGESTHEENN